MATKKKITSWKELTIKAISLGYDIDDIKATLQYRFGKGGGGTREYDKWYDYLERQMIVRRQNKLLEEWAEIIKRLDFRPDALRFGDPEKMHKHIERYRNEIKHI